MFRIVSVSFLVFWCFTTGVNTVYGQCGADGTKPCGNASKGASLTKSGKVNSTKKATAANKRLSKATVVSEIETGIKKGYALIIMENANLRESATVYSGSIREVELNEKLLLIKEEPVGPWYKVFDSKTKSEGWLHGNTIEIAYDSDKNKNKRAPSEAVTRTQINICGTDVNERVDSAAETYKNAINDDDKEMALQQLNLMKTAVLQYRRCLNTGLRLKTITEEEKAVFLDGLEKTKGSLEVIANSIKNLTQPPE